ncbi:YciI family protein [Gryllotalpicola protaetiae]|uniref:YciI family protein n=1 Tax=Gryllotalpicola protaetiae TaxID=2419771 RepID=A0A387BG67_9MICO|nr:YciI family protein [Gryllotalpicola protaetiae]AYG02923.1 YciI family protein [Gryllotalpicola protaetiae]
MSKFMLIMRGTDAAKDAFEQTDFTEVIAAMGAYNESMLKAGVMVGGDGLALEPGLVVDFDQTPPVVTDGPYGETKELFNGFWVLEVPTIEEAAEWAKRAPLPPGNKLEVRRITGPEDFPADNEWIQKEKEWQEHGYSESSATDA